MNLVSARLLSQQLASPQFKEPAEVVSWFGAMQAQEPRSMRWAVAMRMKKPSYKAFEESFNEGKLIRAHLLRCTWQLVTAEDYHWIRQVCYHKGLFVMNGWTTSMGFKFSEKEKAFTLSYIEALLEERGVCTDEEITAALLKAGIPIEHLVYSHHLRMAELERLVCSGPPGPKSTYALVRKRVGKYTPIDRDEALGKLARKFFRSHGPATLEDFVWWSGLNVGDCKRGIAVWSTIFTKRAARRDSGAGTSSFFHPTMNTSSAIRAAMWFFIPTMRIMPTTRKASSAMWWHWMVRLWATGTLRPGMAEFPSSKKEFPFLKTV